ncbi:MAG: hypothetical protein JW847_04655 [Candidatus Omnitrophica bacterium]|nr:hypothetical protein [Candidatus Omnitrophota bacterium]
MIKKLVNALHVSICAVLIFQLVGCGTILYPERKGQKGGKIDVGIALLDGIGLLFFFIPGIIAYAVDFNNGTIYLPGTAKNTFGLDDMKQVKFDPKQCSPADIERILKEQTGRTIRWGQPDMQITELGSTDDMIVQFAQVLPGMQDNDIVFNR